MYNQNQRPIFSYTAVAIGTLAVGVLISLGSDGTWWLLGLAALSWGQAALLRREIRTSGVPLRLFSATSWILLGFALVSLIASSSTRIIGDIVVLLIIALSFVGPRMRRAR